MSNLTKLLMLLSIGLLLTAASIYFIGGKKKTANVATTVKAMPEQVFPFLVETELKKKWLPTLIDEEFVATATELEEGGQPSIDEGVEVVSKYEFGDEQKQLTGRVIRYKQNELVSIKSSNEDITITYFFHLKPKSDSTEIDCRKIVKLNGMNRFLSVFEEDTHESDWEKEVRQLVKVIESEAADIIPNAVQPLEELTAETNEEN